MHDQLKHCQLLIWLEVKINAERRADVQTIGSEIRTCVGLGNDGRVENVRLKNRTAGGPGFLVWRPRIQARTLVVKEGCNEINCRAP